MSEELKPCPFCDCAMGIKSSRDWHHLHGDHTDECIFDEEDPAATVPATPDQLEALVRDWNTRATNATIARLRSAMQEASSDAVKLLHALAHAAEKSPEYQDAYEVAENLKRVLLEALKETE